jgi:hypothetical protein
VPHVEQELPTLPKHLCSPMVFSGVPIVRSSVFCVVFCRSLFVLIKIKVLSFQQDKHPTTLYGECRLRCFECLIIQLQEQFKEVNSSTDSIASLKAFYYAIEYGNLLQEIMTR